MPVDYRADAPRDEWSGDRSCIVQYLSRQAAGWRLHRQASISRPAAFARQAQGGAGPDGGGTRGRVGSTDARRVPRPRAARAHGHHDYHHVLLLGRVTSGWGGDVMMDMARGAASLRSWRPGSISGCPASKDKPGRAMPRQPSRSERDGDSEPQRDMIRRWTEDLMSTFRDLRRRAVTRRNSRPCRWRPGRAPWSVFAGSGSSSSPPRRSPCSPARRSRARRPGALAAPDRRRRVVALGVLYLIRPGRSDGDGVTA